MSDEDLDRFRERYSTSGHAAIMAVELEALGSDYQANGYTTMTQADEIGRALRLERGLRLLDVGSGCGWPGLHLAKEHGCDVISLDPVLEGVGVARDRAARDGLAGRSWQLGGSADALPLRSKSCDAIVHTDVLC